MQTCTCRVPDWRQLRELLGLSRRQMAERLGMTGAGVWLLEQSPHRCPRTATIILLRAWLRSPAWRERLARAGYAYPWPEDLDDGGAVE